MTYIAHLLATTWERFDLILVDVDNGPGWPASPVNAYYLVALSAFR